MLSGETESGRDGAWEDPWHRSSILSISSEGGEELEPRVCEKLEEWEPFFPKGVAGFPVCETGGAGAPFPKEAKFPFLSRLSPQGP